MASMPNHWSWRAQELTDFHGVTTAAAAAVGQGDGGLGGVQAGCRLLDVQVAVGDDEAGAEDPGHGSFERQPCWIERAKRCLLLLRFTQLNDTRQRLSNSPFKCAPELSSRRRKRRNWRRSLTLKKEVWWKKTFWTGSNKKWNDFSSERGKSITFSCSKMTPFSTSFNCRALIFSSKLAQWECSPRHLNLEVITFHNGMHKWLVLPRTTMAYI